MLLCSFLLCQLLGYVSGESIKASVGENVTLPCNYDAQDLGRHPVCWGRGSQFHWDCADKVIKSDRTAVTSRTSERYLLLGDLDQGDVSLTIRRAEESDSGTYSCRVEIPGWFNDHTRMMTLTVVPAPPSPLLIELREVQKRSITVHWTLLFDGGRPVTSYKIYLKHKLASWNTAVTTKVSNPELTQVTFVDLHPAKIYNLRIFAVNNVGISESSNVLTVTTKEAAPEGPPLDMQVEALGSRSIKITWKPPRADLRNGVLQSYSISYREYDPVGRVFKKWQHQSVRATQELESIVLNNLKPSTMYRVLLRAKTNAGIGPSSTAPSCSTLDEVYIASVAATVKSTSAASSSETLTFKSMGVSDAELFSDGTVITPNELKSFLGVENIGRTVAIFFCTLVLIFIFRGRFLAKDSAQHDENIYDSVQRPE